MSDESASTEQEAAQEVIEDMAQEAPQEAETPQEPQEQEEVAQVPLTALQKERKRRQEAEMKAEYLEKQYASNQEEDISRYENATREDLTKNQGETVRLVEERLWAKSNPEKYNKVNEDLPEFLKQKPHLASAIAQAPNRYEEALLLMNAYSDKPRGQPAPRKESKPAPGSPSSVPKGAALDQSVDVMGMSDSEFRSWRQSLRRGR